MNSVKPFKEGIILFYKKYETYINMLVKFIFAFVIFNAISKNIGYYPLLNGMPIRLALSVACAVVPTSIFVLITAVDVCVNITYFSIPLGGLVIMFALILYLLYLKFAPSQGLMTIAIPVLAPFHLHYLVPFIGGLRFNPFTIVPVGASFIFMKAIQYIKVAVDATGGKMEMENILGSYQTVIKGLMNDKELQVMIIAFILIIVATFVVSRLSIDYSWYIGLLVGAIAGIVSTIVLAKKYGVSVNLGFMILGTLISMVIVAAYQYIFHSVVYSRKEKVQFEDDEYYYYVKAIPKANPVVVEDDKEDKKKAKKKPAKAPKVKAPKPGKASKNKIKAKAAEEVNPDYVVSGDTKINAAENSNESKPFVSIIPKNKPEKVKKEKVKKEKVKKEKTPLFGKKAPKGETSMSSSIDEDIFNPMPEEQIPAQEAPVRERKINNRFMDDSDSFYDSDNFDDYE